MSVLEIHVRFLDDRYHGRNDWPPDPARLFQALIHGGRTGRATASWSVDHEAALEWLAELPSPEIEFRPARCGQSYRTFVPNNSLDRTRRSTKTTKEIAPMMLAERSEEPDVIYRWATPESADVASRITRLDELASRILALGWGIDIAAATATMGQPSVREGYDKYIPTQRGGRPMRTLGPGLLNHLRERHEATRNRITAAGVDPYTRPTDFPATRYRLARDLPQRRFCAFQLQRLDGEPFSMEWRRTAIVAAWLRHMAGVAIREEVGPDRKPWIDSYVLGHTKADELGIRLSYLPLPSIGHPHSDGCIRRAMIAEPPGVEHRNAEAFDLLEIKAAGRELTRAGDQRPEAMLMALRDRDPMVRRYVRGSHRWRSVTPVILHGYNVGRKGLSVKKTERLLFQSLDASGLPVEDITHLSFQTAPYWPGVNAAAAIQVPKHLDGWPRLHVAVDFSREIAGPLAIGLGRHCGVGILAAAD